MGCEKRDLGFWLDFVVKKNLAATDELMVDEDGRRAEGEGQKVGEVR